MNFDYDIAYSRNIGWVTESEQKFLKTRRIAIAGLGGVGGSHLLTLTRLGIGGFNIADFDQFDLANFNRQAGANTNTIGKKKLDTMANQSLAINPELSLVRFEQGIREQDIDDFLDGVNLYVDGLDFFVLDIRQKIFRACREKGIPAITAAPLGMGTSFLAFLPGQMSFEEYFRLEGQDQTEQYIRFLVGLSPAMLQMPYLVDPSAADFHNKKGPSTIMGCTLASGVIGTMAAKILLQRGHVPAAPSGLHFDAYRNKLSKTWRPGGNNHPLQKLILAIARKKLAQITEPAKTDPKYQSDHESMTLIEKILDQARWAPSGENAQPWRFEILNETQFRIHGSDTRKTVVYDLEGHASQFAIGALLETIQIAASAQQCSVEFSDVSTPETGQYQIDATLTPNASVHADPLAPYTPIRSVQRRAMSTRLLTISEVTALEQSLPEGYKVVWLNQQGQKWAMTKLLWKTAGLRLTLPEAFPAHKHSIEFDAQFSEGGMPDQSLGLDAVTLKIMKWAMASWERVKFMNTYFAGTLLPRIQMDLIPNLKCATHFAILADKPATTINDFIQAGRATQRFWLAVTQNALQLQPAYTPIVFHEYSTRDIKFTASARCQTLATSVANQTAQILGTDNMERTVFLGRVGAGSLATSRSTRIPLSSMLKNN